MFPYCNIYKFTCTSHDGKTHNQIDQILRGKRWCSSVLDVQSIRGTECDTDHYLMIAEVKERLVVSKHRLYKFHMVRFNLKKLNNIEGYSIMLKSYISLQLWTI
jgi:hypothetical protein